MLVGYGPTSPVDQQASIQTQERDLSAAGWDKLFRPVIANWWFPRRGAI